MKSYTPPEQAFLLYHELLHALFPAALADETVSMLLRARLRQDLPHHVADHLIEVLNYIWEFNDDCRRQDQAP